MRQILGFMATVVAAGISMASPAAASTTVNLTGSSTTSGNQLLYSSVYSTPSGNRTVRFSVVGLTFSGTSIGTLTPTISSAVKYTEGLGIDPSGDDRHTVDNSGKYDFLLFRFDTDVQLTGATFSNANWYRDGVADTDAAISWAAFDYDGFANAAHDQTYATTLSGSAQTRFFNGVRTSLATQLFESNNIGAGTESRIFNTGATPNVGNVWIIGASITNIGNVDSFKLKNVTYLVPPPPGNAVPEPATWAMLILGMGAVGGAMRRRTRGKVAFA